jgi:hypothetical protein
MSYTVILRRNSDQTTVKIVYPYEYSEFLWTAGNWSCDCNRELDFYRAIGEPISPQSDQSNVCLGHGQYSVLEIHVDDGRLVFPDDSNDLDECFGFTIDKIPEGVILLQPHKWKKQIDDRIVCDNCGNFKDVN